MSASAVRSANAAERTWPPSTSRPGATSIGRGIAISLAAHALVLLGLVVAARGQPRPVIPPVYRVALVAAPAAPVATPSAGAFPQRSPATSESRTRNAIDAAAPLPPATSAARAPIADVPAAHIAPKHTLRTPTPPAPARAMPVANAPHVPPPVRTPGRAAAPGGAASHVPAARSVPSPTRASSREVPEPVRHGATSSRSPSPTAPAAGAALGNAPTRASAPATAVRPSRSAATTPAVKAGAARAAEASAGGAAPGNHGPPEHAAERGGSGPPTSHGRDIADVRVVGLEFPFPGYLDNLVRQVRLRFAPTQARAALHADLSFVVARDGSISGLRVVRSSGSYAFDLEAQGAVEAAGAARAFGPLPDGFRPPSLPVTFSFDPRSTP